MKKQSIWCNRNLHVSPYMGLCLTQKEFQTEYQSFVPAAKGVPRYPTGEGGAMTCELSKDDTRELLCIVAVSEEHTDDPVELVKTLTHEAVHVWQFYCDEICETNPSPEFMAYGISYLAAELIMKYNELTASRKKKRSRSL